MKLQPTLSLITCLFLLGFGNTVLAQNFNDFLSSRDNSQTTPANKTNYNKQKIISHNTSIDTNDYQPINTVNNQPKKEVHVKENYGVVNSAGIGNAGQQSEFNATGVNLGLVAGILFIVFSFILKFQKNHIKLRKLELAR